MRPRVLGIVGLRAAGKQTTADYLKERGVYADSIDISDDVLRPEARERGIKSLADLFPLYKALGTDYFFNRVTGAVDRAPQGIVVSSVRELALYERLKERYGDDLFLLALEASSARRFEMLLRRGRAGDFKTFTEFANFELKETEFYRTDRLMKKAKVTFYNTRQKEFLLQFLDALFRTE